MDIADFKRGWEFSNLKIESIREGARGISLYCVPSGHERPDECPYCGGKSLDVHKTIEKRIMDVPYRHQKVIICFPYRRYRCRDCRKIIGAKFDWIDEHSKMTTRLERQIATDCFYYSFHNVASRYFVSEPTVLSLFSKYIAQHSPQTSPKHLGIEPVTIEDHTYGIFLNLFTGKVVEMSDSYSVESVAKVLDRMYPTDTPTRICMNLGDELFKGVHDRFPSVTMYYNTNSIISGMAHVIEEQCLNSVTNRKIGQLLSMPGSKLLNYQNRQLQSFFKKNPEIEKLYFLKESFDEAIENKEMLDDWFDQVQSSKFSKLQIDRGMLFNYPGMELSVPLNLPGHGYSFDTIRNLVIFRPN